MNKRLLYPLAMALFVISSIELISYFYLQLLVGKYPWDFFYPHEKFSIGISQETIDYWQKTNAHHGLGWAPQAGLRSANNCLGDEWKATFGKLGERINTTQYSNHQISIYGDSFVVGDEVNDHETIGYFLSNKTKTNVRNFGVGGYGIDQALLRFEHNLPTDSPKVAILSLYSGGLDRVLSSHRSFLHPFTGVLIGFKPRFFKEKNQFVLLPPPKQIKNSDDLKNYLKRYADTDYWYQFFKENKPHNTFPYSLNLLNAFIKLQQINSWGRGEEIFQNAMATETLTYILERFISTSIANNIRPVILVIPSHKDVENHMRKKDVSYRKYLDFFSSGHDVKIIDMIKANSLDWNQFFLKNYECHAAKYGNEKIAEEIFKQI